MAYISNHLLDYCRVYSDRRERGGSMTTYTPSRLEFQLQLQIRAMGLPEPEQDYQFHPSRRFRFDFAWVDKKLAVEVEEGTHSNGRHTRGVEFENDCIKYGEAMKLGWNVYRCTGAMIQNGTAIETVQILLGISDE